MTTIIVVLLSIVVGYHLNGINVNRNTGKDTGVRNEKILCSAIGEWEGRGI